MDVSEPTGKVRGRGSQLGAPTLAEDPLTRLWERADAWQGHHVEAVAELRERKRREQEASRSGRRVLRKSRTAAHEAAWVECERCKRTVRRADAERVAIPSPVDRPAQHLLCPRCVDEVQRGLLRLLAGQLPVPDPEEHEVPLSIPARPGWFAFRMGVYCLIGLVVFVLVTWLFLR